VCASEPVEAMFRATVPEILGLASLILPAIFTTPDGRDRVNAVEGLCIVLRRLAFPSRWEDLKHVFGRSRGPLSCIFHHTMNLILQVHGHLMNFNPTHFRHRLARWARKIIAKGADASLGIALFIDCTVRGVCRPCPRNKRILLCFMHANC
jgi:hypothetical protein